MLTFHENGKTYKLEIDDINLIIDYDHDSSPYFTWRGCENCADEEGKILGNDVYDCKVYPSLSHCQVKDYWEKKLCSKCIYEHEYGKGSFES